MARNTGEGRYSPAVNRRRREKLEGRPKRCGCCGRLGHNRRGCPEQYSRENLQRKADLARRLQELRG